MIIRPQMMWFQLLLVFLLSSFISGVDRNNFKKCSDSAFCKLHREFKPDTSVYKVLPKSVTVKGSSINLHIISYKNTGLLNAQLFALEDNTWRLKIAELSPLKKRYEIPVGDVLLQEPQLQRLEVKYRDEERIVVSAGSSVAIIQFFPFVLDVVISGKNVLSVNSRGLMKYQQTRASVEGGGIMSSFIDWLAVPFRDKEETANQTSEVVDESVVTEAVFQGPADYKQSINQGLTSVFSSSKMMSWTSTIYTSKYLVNELDLPEEDDYLPGEESFKGFKDSKPNGPQSVGVDIQFPGFQHVFGVPEHADSLALKSTKDTDPYRLYNLDVFEYELNNPMALYGSVPFMIAHNVEQTIGLYWHNPSETWIDVEEQTKTEEENEVTLRRLSNTEVKRTSNQQMATHWFSETGHIDLFIMLGPRPRNVFSQYAKLTGTTPLPPLFSLAYHQCRWNYMDEADVRSVHAKFEEYDIPVDVLWLDIEHTDGKRYFVWDKHKFEHAEEMLRNVSAKGRRMVATVDPHLKKDSSYYVYNEAYSDNVLVKNRDGSEYEGWCWPGSSAWVDFICPEARHFWARQFDLNTYQGSTLDLYTWNDMNEPSVFNGPEVTMQKDVVHCDGSEHRELHNIYGLYVHRATSEALEKRSSGQFRPFVLSRAFYAGSQRYGAVWTGDNAADWNHLKASLPMLLTLNLVGITFSGADVGGFFGNPDPELLTRWYQAGAFQPFFRAHAHLDTKRREPWLLPQANMEAVRQTIRLRYRLMPYWYTLFREGEGTGMPVIRPLFVEFPSVRQTFSVEDEHMLGGAILIHPVTSPGVSQVDVYLPGRDEIWYDFDSYEAFTSTNSSQKSFTVSVPVDLKKIPVFLRGGYIIPLKERIRRTSDLVPDDPYSLLIVLDKQQNSKGHLYHDDFKTFQYRNGAFVHMHYRFKEGILDARNLNDRMATSHYQTSSVIERITVVGLLNQPTSIHLVLATAGSESKVSLQFSYDSMKKVLTIRKPDIPIAANFKMSFMFS